MPPFRGWEELPPELLCSIGDNILDLKSYSSARWACTAWRCALVPPSPSLLLFPDYLSSLLSAASIPTRRTFQLKSIDPKSQCVGSSSGWLALADPIFGGQSTLSLFNPITDAKIDLPPLILLDSTMHVSKIVLAPSPARDDFAAVAICGMDRLAYVTAGARRWAILDPLCLTRGDHLTDLVYHDHDKEAGRVYCLTSYGDVHVLHLPERRRREPVLDDEPSSQLVIIPIIHLAQRSEAPTRRAIIHRRSQTQQQHAMIHRRSAGPDLNAPAKVEPLLSLPFDPATTFALPFYKISLFTSAKNLVFCGGNLYQIWRNASCTMTVQLPEGGGRRRIEENEVFVLRYYPGRQPCWDAVTDLGGYSVFVGRNNAVSMYAQDVPGLKANCVYWIGGRGRDQGMVFDMATGRSTPCLPTGVAPQITVCWYFLGGMVDNCNFINGSNRVLSDPSESSVNQEKQQD